MWIQKHPGWTYRDYDETAASDLALHAEFEALLENLTDGK